jgi:dihydrofolate synthase/folylpolyglutamate synthase
VTQFEALTAAAYWELARAGAEVAVVEAGLGGRYDATSVIDSRVQILTNVGLEHTRWLGPTERHIAEEKLAVVTEGGTLITGALGPQARRVAEAIATQRGAEILVAGRDVTSDEREGGLEVTTGRARYGRIELRALGRFQRDNFALATAAAEAFLDVPLELEAVRAAARELSVRGRLEVVAREPMIILDGAHNPDGARALVDSLRDVVGNRRVTAVVSVMDDKDAAGILAALLPLCAHAVFTRSSRPNTLPPATLQSLWRQLGGPAAHVEADPAQAVAAAIRAAGREGAVVVTGSIYLLSDLLRGSLTSALRSRAAGRSERGPGER